MTVNDILLSCYIEAAFKETAAAFIEADVAFGWQSNVTATLGKCAHDLARALRLLEEVR